MQKLKTSCLSRRSFVKNLGAVSMMPLLTGFSTTNYTLSSNDHTKVLLDTDIGTDPDDGACLAYVLLQKRCDLLGITTVGKDAPIRAQLAEMIANSLDRTDVPIAAGAKEPLFSNIYWWDHHLKQKYLLDKYQPQNTYKYGQAVSLMKENIDQYPNEITLLCVGPLTNAAALWASYPGTFKLLKDVVVMGGYFHSKTEYECNTMLDPTAAAAIYQRSGIPIRVAGLEQTRPLSVPQSMVKQWFSKPKYQPLREFCGKGNRLGMHDPLAAAIIFNENLCEYKRGHVNIRLKQYDVVKDKEAEEVTGYTTFTPDDNGPHKIVTNTRKEKFHAHLAAIWEQV
mgnify:CR=1 FL=1